MLKVFGFVLVITSSVVVFGSVKTLKVGVHEGLPWYYEDGGDLKGQQVLLAQETLKAFEYQFTVFPPF